MLGWIFAEEGDKAHPFDLHCSALGVFFDVSVASSGKAFISNTEARSAELCDELSKVVKDGKLTNKNAQRLRGRMQFAESQLFGRTGRRCMRVLTDFAEGRKYSLSHKDKFFLLMFRDLLQSNVPREVRSLSDENVVIFTDACYERNDSSWPCGLGGVIVAENSVAYFSVAVDQEMRALLGENVKKQIIFEVETLAAVLSLSLWRSSFGSKCMILFVDNEGTKFSLLKGVSDNACVDRMAETFAKLECDLHAMIWIARVPSKSNIADPPSRGVVDIPFFNKAENHSKLAELHLQEMISQMMMNRGEG